MQDYELMNLQTNYPDVYKNMVEYHHDSACKYRLILTMNDGSRIVYNDMLGTVSDPRLNRYNPAPLTEEEWNMEFASRLTEIMQTKRWTQASLADATGISQGMIGKYVRGESIPSIRNLVKMTKAMNYSPEDLIDFL